MTKYTPEEKIIRARVKMYEKSPFFSYVLLHMPFIEDKDGNYLQGMPTVGVDREGNVYWNRGFVDGLTEDNLAAIICHEVLHQVLLHIARAGTRDKKIFNIAADLVVNCIIAAQNNNYTRLFTLPEGCLVPDQNHEFTINGTKISGLNNKSAEEVYDEMYSLIPKKKKGKKGSGDDEEDGVYIDGEGITGKDGKLKKGFDKHIYGKKGKNGEEEEESGKEDANVTVAREQKWKRITADAAVLAKQRGMLPAGLERFVDKIIQSKIDWRTLLYNTVVPFIPSDFTWRRPSRRGLSIRTYLPDTIRECTKCVYHVDTSGSRDRDDLSESLGNLQGIMQAFSSFEVDVLIGDAIMQNTFKLTSTNRDDLIDIAMGMRGGGGTSHVYVFEHVRKHMPEAKILICDTDGYTEFPEDPENNTFETIWLLSRNSVAENQLPFGKVIKMSRSDD